MSSKKDTELPKRTPDLTDAGYWKEGKDKDKWENEERRYRRTVTLTCETPTCRNYLRVWADKVDDNADGIWRIACGLCGEWIENITPDPAKQGFTRKSFKDANGREWDGELTDFVE